MGKILYSLNCDPYVNTCKDTIIMQQLWLQIICWPLKKSRVLLHVAVVIALLRCML